jgi:hypothetical protein
MRMRAVLTVLWIVASGLVLFAAPAAGQVAEPATPLPREVRRPQAAPGFNPHEPMGLTGIVVPYVRPLSGKLLAGLREQAAAASLTWQRVYELALVRSRSGATAMAETLDPQALADQARRHGVADFARFRKEFLTGRTETGGAFHDPSEAYYGLLRRVQTIDNARRYIAQLENVHRLIAELIQGEGAGLSQLDIDLITAALTQARRDLSREMAGFRDHLDKLKVALGLSPRAPVIVDGGEIAGFGEVRDLVDSWTRRPDRNLAALPEIFGRLPTLGDAVVNGRPILGEIEQVADRVQVPDRLEDILEEATRAAIKNRAGADGAGAPADRDVALELNVRRRIRHLLELRGDDTGQKRRYELAIRMQDQAFERFVTSTPTGAPSQRSTMLRAVIDEMGRARDAEDRLATLWASFRTERLALYRDLGVLPYDNWDAFYADLPARSSALKPAPAVAPAELVPAVPAPPPPPPAGP